MTVRNPYFSGGIVTDPSMFFGRVEELEYICFRLHGGQSTSVVGLRRIGKSSLLYHLAHQADLLPPATVAVFIDLQAAAHHHSLGLLNSALHGLDKKLNNRYSFPPVKSLHDFAVGIERVCADGFRPLLCLNEMECIAERESFDQDVFRGLRALCNHGRLTLVTASTMPLSDLIRDSGLSSPFYNIFIELSLGALSDEAVRALLTEPFRKASLSPPPDDHLIYIMELAGHHPFYLQLAAYHLFEMYKSSGVLNRLTLRRAFVKDAEPHFRQLWYHLNAEEQAGAQKLAGVPATVQDWARLRNHLFVVGLADDTESPHLFSTVLEEMIKTEQVTREPLTRRRYPHRTNFEGVEPKLSHLTIPSLLTYALVALVSASVALLIALLLPQDRFWPFFVILTVILTFVLVLADKLTGGQFLGWLSKLLGK